MQERGMERADWARGTGRLVTREGRNAPSLSPHYNRNFMSHTLNHSLKWCKSIDLIDSPEYYLGTLSLSTRYFYSYVSLNIISGHASMRCCVPTHSLELAP